MKKSFEDICKFDIGEKYWESSQYGNVQFKVTTKPTIGGNQVWFIAETVEGGSKIEYLVTKGLEHYGPSIYDEPAYMSLSELRG